MKKIYISLPIKGREKSAVRIQNLTAMNRVKALGQEPISPLNNGLPYDAPDNEHMKRDYKMLLDCDAIYLCDGWEYSHGCMNELQVAADCRLIVLTEDMTTSDINIKLNGKVINPRK